MAEAADPYASTSPSQPKGRVAGVLTLLAAVFLVFVIAKVGGTISSNSAVFEELYAVAEGDNVTVTYTIRSAETGQILSSSEMPADDGHDHEHAPSALRFEVGSGGSGFGADFERAVVGHYQGETVKWGPIDGAAAFGGWTRLPQTFPRSYGPFELGQTLDARFVTAYEQQVGPLNKGDTIRVFRDFPWSQTVVEKGNDSVVIRHAVADGDSYPWDVPPSSLVLDVDEAAGNFVVRFDVVRGTTFNVLPDSSGALFFEPGSYRIADANDEEIFLEHNPAPDPALLGGDVVIEIHILGIEK